MSKFFKWLSVALLALVALVGIASLAVYFLVDTTFIKNQVTSRIEEKIGGTLTIEDATVYPLPIIRVAVEGVAWSDPARGITASMASLVLKFPFYQLLGSDPIETTLELNEPLFHKTAASAVEAPATPTEPTPEAPQGAPSGFQEKIRSRLVLERLRIDNGELLIDGTTNFAAKTIMLSVGPLAFEDLGDQHIDLNLSATITQGPLQGPVAARGTVAFNLDQGVISLSGLTLELWNETLDIDGTITNFNREHPENALLDLHLRNQALSLDKWLAIKAPEKNPEIEGTIAVDLALKSRMGDLQSMAQTTLVPAGVKGELTVNFNRLRVKGGTLENGRLHLLLRESVLRLDPLTIDSLTLTDPPTILQQIALRAVLDGADLIVNSLTAEYLSGTLELAGTIRNFKTAPAFSVKANAKDLNLAQLPPSAGKKPGDYTLGGIARMALTMSGSAENPAALKENTSAIGSFVVTDMPLPEIDLSQRSSQRQLPPPLQARADEQLAKIRPIIEKTLSVKRLDTLSGNVTYTAGAMTLSDARATNPNFDVTWDGTVSAQKKLAMAGNIFIAKARTDELIKSQSIASGVAAGLTDANGRMRIPFTVSGTAEHPKVALDYGDIAQTLVKSAVESGAVRETIKKNIEEGGTPARETIEKGVEELKKGEPGKVLRDIFKK